MSYSQCCKGYLCLYHVENSWIEYHIDSRRAPPIGSSYFFAGTSIAAVKFEFVSQ